MKKIFSKLVVLVIILATVKGPVFSLDEEKFITDYMWSRFIRLNKTERPKIALVLGGGGARGMAHIGVLKVLEEEKVPVDIVVGTSIGALIGALYAAGVPVNKIEKMGELAGWDDITNLTESTIVKLLLTEHLLSTEKMENYLHENIGHKRFDELDIPFACVATDLVTGERVILREGDVALAARASSTIPGIFDPVEYRHRFLIDGGLFDNIPTDVAKLLGADFIIVSAVSADFSKNNISNAFMILTQSIYIQGKHLDSKKLELADILIIPKVKDVSAVDLGRSRECIDAGNVAARQALHELQEKLIEMTNDKYLFR